MLLDEVDLAADPVGGAALASMGCDDVANCAEDRLGELVELGLDWLAAALMAGFALGGGGSGAMPTLFLSAAAAAADAYWRPSGLVGTAAGFMPAGATGRPLPIVGSGGVCRVARVGSGDLSWDADFRVAVGGAGAGASAEVRSLPLATALDERASAASGFSSCRDWVSWLDNLSLSCAIPNTSSSSSKFSSSYMVSSWASTPSGVMPLST